MTYKAPSAHKVRDFLIRQIPLTCAIVGLFALAFGGWDYYAMHRFLDRSEPVEVIVEKIDVERKGKRFGRPERIKLRIHYRVLADDRRGHSTYWKIGRSTRIGDVRDAFLDPQTGRIYSQAHMNYWEDFSTDYLWVGAVLSFIGIGILAGGRLTV